MTFPVAQTIKEIGAKKLAAATSIPLRTIYRWGELDKVSGKGIVHAMRLNLLKEAAERIKAKPASKKRARAAA